MTLLRVLNDLAEQYGSLASVFTIVYDPNALSLVTETLKIKGLTLSNVRYDSKNKMYAIINDNQVEAIFMNKSEER